MKICGEEIKITGRVVRLARLDAEKFRFLKNDPELVMEGLRKSGIRVDLFTFMQRLNETTAKYDYPIEHDNLAAIPITTFDNWWNKQLGFKARNKAKQAEKRGVRLYEVPFNEELARGICEIYNECPIRQGRKFPHYGKDLQMVYRETATYLESSIFVGAFFEGKLIGFVKIVSDAAGEQAGLMNIISLIQHRDKAPTNALVAHAVKACASRGIAFLTYSNFSYGKKLRDTLSDFKERNGFQRIEVPRYYVPMTQVGHVALKLGLHRRLSERIPESIAERLRAFREGWYRRRFPSFTEAA